MPGGPDSSTADSRGLADSRLKGIPCILDGLVEAVKKWNPRRVWWETSLG